MSGVHQPYLATAGEDLRDALGKYATARGGMMDSATEGGAALSPLCLLAALTATGAVGFRAKAESICE